MLALTLLFCRSFSRSRTNVEDKGTDKDLANIKAEIDKIRQSEIVVFDESTKSHLREFIHKNSDKFVKRASSKELSPSDLPNEKTKKESVQSPLQSTAFSGYLSKTLILNSNVYTESPQIWICFNKAIE